jgi:predicted GNAT superfamily acetyltransferase
MNMTTSAIVIRDIKSFDEMRAVEELQKDVWEFADLDVVPRTLLVAGRAVGGVLVGAYDGSALVGFVYGFPGYENGEVMHHSHMLAVKPEYRNSNLGYKLKLAQRDRVLAQNIKQITWTFDPLQSRNAYFNFAKLGVVADSYRADFYGEATSSFLHQAGTDRLWVTWPLDSQRVRERLKEERKISVLPDGAQHLVEVGIDLSPKITGLPDLRGQHLVIAIPADINALQIEKTGLAVEWRQATRWAFSHAMKLGYRVEEFYRLTDRNQSVGSYLLSCGTSGDLAG